jgi:formylglycine-generating enzyme required for sulfatase activity
MRTVRHLAIPLSLALCLIVVGLGTAQPRPAEAVAPAPELNPKAVVWRTPDPPANPEIGDIWVNPKDGMELVFVAPGEFVMGTSDAQVDVWVAQHPTDGPGLFANEQPQFRSWLAGYWIGRTEVTNAQYLRFVEATGHRAPEYWEAGQIPAGLADFPVTMVSWDDAAAYCAWAGGSLPTERQWEKAARGMDARVFPWGNQWDPQRCRDFQVVSGEQPPFQRAAVLAWLLTHNPVFEGPAKVGSYPSGASPYGCLDMSGNVDEWCLDFYDRKAYEGYQKGRLAPPATGDYRILRGGSWYSITARAYRCAYRTARRPAREFAFTGFRCARSGS